MSLDLQPLRAWWLLFSVVVLFGASDLAGQTDSSVVTAQIRTRRPPDMKGALDRRRITLGELVFQATVPTEGGCDSLQPMEANIDFETGVPVPDRTGKAWVVSKDTITTRLIWVVWDKAGHLVSYHDFAPLDGYEVYVHPGGGPNVVRSTAGMVAGSSADLLGASKLGPPSAIIKMVNKACRPL